MKAALLCCGTRLSPAGGSVGAGRVTNIDVQELRVAVQGAGTETDQHCCYCQDEVSLN